MQTKHANAVVCISLLGYPASDVDGIDLYEIPHLVIWPVELQQHCHSISSSKKSKVAQAAHANSEKQYGWVCRSHLCLASFQCRRYVSIYKQSACWQWCICCLCITGPVALLHLRHSIGPHHQLLRTQHYHAACSETCIAPANVSASRSVPPCSACIWVINQAGR